MYTLDKLTDEFFDGLEFDMVQPRDTALSDKLCFKNAMDTFLRTGKKEDAFVVYFCFSEIFKLFGDGYENTQKLLETLSDHEYHTGELLSKHRDHYSHSVYVFALGLAVYEYDLAFRREFLSFYGLNDNSKSKTGFLKLWGMVALFHDIGYPFQLAHEQMKTYTQELWGGNNSANPYVTFGNMDNFLSIDEEAGQNLLQSLGRDFTSINQLLSYGLNLREGYDEAEMCSLLSKRVLEQRKFMDHGYFSSVILAKQLFSVKNFKMSLENLDVLTAILLHNSLNKYDVNDAHPIAVGEHPLAYLLMLCDELQDWDRMPYGKASKRDPIAWSIEIDISNNFIAIKYYFDSSTVKALFSEKSDNKGTFYTFMDGDEECSFQESPKSVREGEERINKSFAEIQSGFFVAKIISGYTKYEKPDGDFVKPFIRSDLKICATAEVKRKRKAGKLFASDNRFINLCDFAKAIHSSYQELCRNFTSKNMNKMFGELPLEFKISNIEQAKSYAERLELANCFYSSKDLDYDVIDDFKTADFGNKGEDNFGFLCRGEHVRWVKEKLAMGWRYGEENKDYTAADREKKKLNKCIVPYECLDAESKLKDGQMIQNIIPLLRKFGNNIKIYKYRAGFKPDFVISGIGYRYIAENKETIKREVTRILSEYNEEYKDEYNVIVRTGFSYGAEQIIAECAIELGITVKAALPYDYEKFIGYVKRDAIENGLSYTNEDESRLRSLLAVCAVTKFFGDKDDGFISAAQYSMSRCNKLIVIWDNEDKGVPINRGGIYHCIQMAKQRLSSADIHTISCHRK